MSQDQDLACLSAGYVDDLLEAFQRDPESVSPAWRRYFEAELNGGPNGHAVGANGAVTAEPAAEGSSVEEPHRSQPAAEEPSASRAAPQTAAPAWSEPDAGPATTAEQPGAVERPVQAFPENLRSMRLARLQDRVDQLVRAYRVRGHMLAQLDPLGFERPDQPELDPGFYGFGPEDWDIPFSTSGIGGPATQTLRQIVTRLRNTYCGAIGAQFMHIVDGPIRAWLSQRMESSENRLALSRDQQVQILTRLTDAVIFEKFVRKKFVGAKTFSLEGAETLIPLLHLALEKAGSQGVEEVVLAMAHRGRLNVLVNIVGKSPRELFVEFADPNPGLHLGRGDVKYHLGYSGDWKTASGGRVHLSLCFNPSHLEYVNPVALGRLRAKQDRFDDAGHQRGLALLIHGDAALAGEGIVQETFNLSRLKGYSTGGALHVVVNNQIGFTTNPEEARSGDYATDIAKMLEIPIFHVNGEHPEAVAQVVELALDFRARFQRDVVIDMYCYRRYGHNESDEPGFTQPLMYRQIESRASVRDSYLRHLLKLNEIGENEAAEIAEQRQAWLEEGFSRAQRDAHSHQPSTLGGVWRGYLGGTEPADDRDDTGVPRRALAEILHRLTELPEGFQPHPKIKRFLQHRREMAAGERMLDWSAAEALAFGTLALAGHRIRLSGQDCGRGTFSHRHAVLFDYESGRPYLSLGHVGEGQAQVEILNSPLSEAGVLGFEYGYSLDCPEGLVLWEAQFGDFWNAAQVIVDQFIASAEDKWRRLSGLVLLLPHGFEGQGPEHSSARVERFLMLAAEHNMQVACPSTPAQYYHCLRRQALRRWRKPLVLLTPKSLLRHPLVVSSLEDLAAGRFQRVIPDTEADPAAVERVLLCSGKVYYELAEARKSEGRDDLAIVRVEQFYPFPETQLRAALAPYAPETEFVWVQEEPENMGAWRYLKLVWDETMSDEGPLFRVSRPASASPATGSHASHLLEQQHLLAEAMGKLV